MSIPNPPAPPTSLKSTSRYRPIEFEAGSRDIERLNSLSKEGMRAGVEQFDTDSYLDDVIPKPWGYEYRAYVDDYFDFWALHIESPHSTSMHVHPRKVTYLLCLSGQGVTSGLAKSVDVGVGTMLRIAPGAFHTTRSTGGEPLELIEVETPRNKFDLLRLEDGYSRVGAPYESDHRDAGRPMRAVRNRPHARIRPRSPDKRTEYSVRTGFDVFYRRAVGDMFYVPLCMSGAVHREVEILTNASDPRRPNTDTVYLAINRPERTEEPRP